MSPEALLAELERLSAILDDENADNTAGRVEILKYDVLPDLLRANRHTILKALRAYCPQEEKDQQPDRAEDSQFNFSFL